MSDSKLSELLMAPVKKDPVVTDLAKAAMKNTNYRTVLQTTTTAQIVLMNVRVDVPKEQHLYSTQIVAIVDGEAAVLIDKQAVNLSAGETVMIPPGAVHTIFNRLTVKTLKLYTIYSPPVHDPDEVVE